MKALQSYRTSVLSYFQALDTKPRGLGESAPVETGEAAALRFELNKNLDYVREIVSVAGSGPKSTMEDFPWGSYQSKPVDPLAQIFSSSDDDRNPQAVLDLIERTIGVYRRNRTKAAVRTINPFFWLDQVFDAVSELPFLLLRRMGIARRREVRSPVGKLMKVVLYLLLIIAAGVGVADLLGYGAIVRAAVREVLDVL